MTKFRFIRFNVTHEAMGSVSVFFGDQQLRWLDDCKTDQDRHELIAHEAWRKLWGSPAKKMLKGLCDKLGVDAVKKKFTDSVKVEIEESLEV